jgi:hypothetical protein
MPNLDDFNQRIQTYQQSTESLAVGQLFGRCNSNIFRHVPDLQPQSPPSTADLALRIKEVCLAAMPWRQIYAMLEKTIQNQHQGYGVSKPVVFHYVSNMIIALAVYQRHGKTLSSDILIRLVNKLDLRHPVLRAGLELLAEESLRRCYRAY